MRQCSLSQVDTFLIIEVSISLCFSDNEEADDFTDPALLQNLNEKHETSGIIREFVTLMAVCHTVIPERDPEEPTGVYYQASSPGI